MTRVQTIDDEPLEPGIASVVLALNKAGVRTVSSCQGGPGHAYPEPTVRLATGDQQQAIWSTGVAIRLGLPIASLRCQWDIFDDVLVGPNWEMTFIRSLIPATFP